MKEKRYYIAYGSNLNVGQMRMRCPSARIIGTSVLKDYELLFKGSKTGSFPISITSGTLSSSTKASARGNAGR